MHSRIFQLSSEPITEDSFIQEYDLPEWFVGHIADYVCEDENSNESWDWLFKNVGDLFANHENGKITFTRDDLKDWYSDVLFDLHNTLEEMTSDTKNAGYDMYKIQSKINERFGFYIMTEEYGLLTLNEFLYEVGSFIDNDDFEWYMGGTLDYHS